MAQTLWRRSNRFLSGTCLFFALALTPSTFAASWRPPVLKPISDLSRAKIKLDPDAVKLELTETELEKKSWVQLRGRSEVRNVNIIWTTRFIKLSPEGDFELQVPLEGKVTPVTLTAIDDYGRVEKANYEVVFDDWEIYRATLKESLTTAESGNKFSVGLGSTLISYFETGVPDYSSIALTGKANFSRSIFSARWSVGISGFLTLGHLSQTYPASARFLGLNFRLGYHFLNILPPWKLSLQVGSYYTTMLVAGNQFGFENVNGPQLYPVVERTLKDGKSLRGYLKISPLTTNYSGFSFQSREIALGGDYTFSTFRGKPLSVGVDFSDLFIKLEAQDLSARTISLSLTTGI